MSKKFLSAIFWLVIFSILAVSCSDNLMKDKEQIVSKQITVQRVLAYMEAMQSDTYNYLDSINVKKLYRQSGETVYFADIVELDSWASHLLYIEIEDGEIVNISNTGISGLSRLFSYELVNMSQGEFLMVTSASHMGNGKTYFFPLDSMSDYKYEIEMVGYLGISEERFHIENSEYIFMKADGPLSLKLHDQNADGHTDILLTGLIEFITSEDEICNQLYCEIEYIYNLELDDFSLGEISYQELSNK